MGRGTIVMMQLMASMQSEAKCVTDAINALQKYKDSDFKGDEPAAQLMMCIIKWEQGENANPMEVVDKAMREEAIVQRAKEEIDSERNTSTIPENYISEKETNENSEVIIRKIPMGEHGDA